MQVTNKQKYFKPYYKVNDNHVTIMWDYQIIKKINCKGEEVETPLAIWQEHTFNHIPTLEEVQNVVIDYYNSIISNQIIGGFVWKGYQVWLSSENQINYKTLYDLAIQTQGATLPVTVKFNKDNTQSYYTFTDIEELTDFYLSLVNHIQTTLKNGWLKKDNIDWTVFQK